MQRNSFIKIQQDDANVAETIRYSTEDNHTLRITIQYLRQKLGDDPMLPRYIMTEAGVGYRLKGS